MVIILVKNALYLSVNVFRTRALMEDTILIFTSHSGDRAAILSGHPSHAKVYPFAGQREYLHFPVILRPGIEPMASRSAVKRSTDLANPTTVKNCISSDTFIKCL